MEEQRKRWAVVISVEGTDFVETVEVLASQCHQVDLHTIRADGVDMAFGSMVDLYQKREG